MNTMTSITPKEITETPRKIAMSESDPFGGFSGYILHLYWLH